MLNEIKINHSLHYLSVVITAIDETINIKNVFLDTGSAGCQFKSVAAPLITEFKL